MTTIHVRVADAKDRIARAGVPRDEANVDARLLAQFVLGWDTVRLLTDGHEAAPPEFVARYEALVERRVTREPIAYITGQKEFWGLPFDVSPAVLIPRPETELIVEATLGRFKDSSAPIALADVGTGSGILAVALARERAHATVMATDVSPEALKIARRNAVKHGVADRVRFLETDLLDGVSATFDLIVSNPPYVPERDRSTLAPEVRDHEPSLALFAGDDGLSVVRRLLNASIPRLERGGTLVVEFGFGQEDQVRALISEASGLTLIEMRRDLQGIPRVAIAGRNAL